MYPIKLFTILWIILLLVFGISANTPKMLCYSIQPNDYVNDHAEEIAEMFDGFFYIVGSWDSGVTQRLGLDGVKAKDLNWMKDTRKNIRALKKAGATENLLGVSFGQTEEWPSSETLLSEKFTQKMVNHFGRIAEAAKELGFRGLSIDVEYPYHRYQIDNEIYTYDNYTINDLLKAANRQGRAIIAAVLEKFPQAVIMCLPGYLRSRPISQAFQLGMLEMMAEQDAVGGFHLGTEFTYALSDPLTYLATTISERCGIHLLTNDNVLSYWQKRCTMAPGVWPLHMVETGSNQYVMQPWKDEIKDLEEQMRILRTVSDKYIWSFTGNPIWYEWSEEVEAKYGLKKQTFKQDDINIKDWQNILRKKEKLKENNKWYKTINALKDYKQGNINEDILCDRFGTPSKWWLLGMLGNPHSQPQFAADGACFDEIDRKKVYFGRDQVVHWTEFDNMDPRGMISLLKPFRWFNTDNSSAQLVSFIHADKEYDALIHVGWDDGIIVYIDGKVVFDKRNYPKRGKGLYYLDRYHFEKVLPIKIKKGRSRLSVVSINSHGKWIYSLRITDKNGLPINGLHFDLK